MLRLLLGLLRPRDLLGLLSHTRKYNQKFKHTHQHTHQHTQTQTRSKQASAACEHWHTFLCPSFSLLLCLSSSPYPPPLSPPRASAAGDRASAAAAIPSRPLATGPCEDTAGGAAAGNEPGRKSPQPADGCADLPAQSALIACCDWVGERERGRGGEDERRVGKGAWEGESLKTPRAHARAHRPRERELGGVSPEDPRTRARAHTTHTHTHHPRARAHAQTNTRTHAPAGADLLRQLQGAGGAGLRGLAQEPPSRRPGCGRLQYYINIYNYI